MADLFGDAIKTLGHAVEVYTNPMLASERIALHSTSYALVLGDIRMPGLTGIELAQ